jgi:hypothetical protein
MTPRTPPMRRRTRASWLPSTTWTP